MLGNLLVAAAVGFGKEADCILEGNLIQVERKKMRREPFLMFFSAIISESRPVVFVDDNLRDVQAEAASFFVSEL